ncbi:hypothetical protein QQP08_023850 [Theobroma cacao]|nr:hypothetical protein QQP08_023850 [Theobroma cacao]
MSSNRQCRMGSTLQSSIARWRSLMVASGLAPTIAAAAPSEKSAEPTSMSKWVSEGGWKHSTMSSEQTISTRAPALFFAKSLERRRAVPAAKQPC